MCVHTYIYIFTYTYRSLVTAGLADGGVDLLALEAVADAVSAKAAIYAAGEAGAGVPAESWRLSDLTLGPRAPIT